MTGLYTTEAGSLLWRAANIVTFDLSVNALTSLTPIMSLVWLYAWHQAQLPGATHLLNIPRPGLLAAGTTLIPLANLALHQTRNAKFPAKTATPTGKAPTQQTHEDPPMTQARYYQVLADVTESQYHRLTSQSQQDITCFPPKLHLYSRQGNPFTEKEIPAIVADAIHLMTDLPLETRVNAGHEAPDYQVLDWPLTMKAAIMHDAMDQWGPGEFFTTSAWNTSQAAAEFLQNHPELLTMFDRPSKETAAQWTANHSPKEQETHIQQEENQPHPQAQEA